MCLRKINNNRKKQRTENRRETQWLIGHHTKYGNKPINLPVGDPVKSYHDIKFLLCYFGIDFGFACCLLMLILGIMQFIQAFLFIRHTSKFPLFLFYYDLGLSDLKSMKRDKNLFQLLRLHLKSLE